MSTEWQPAADAPKDRMINLYCPGVSTPTQGVLQGMWDNRNNRWMLNPYGTAQAPTLYPSMWCDLLPPPPEGITPGKPDGQ